MFSQIMLVATFAVASSLSLAGGYGKYGMKSKDNGKDIVTTAVEAGQFNTLAAALKAADLVGTLQGDGPFTVFAPTDAAFEKLPAGTVEKLLMPENRDQLISILTYHVVAGKVDSGQVVNLSSAKTVNGKELKIDTATGSVRVDNATVVKADIMASNGIIHVIDTVVIPAS
ncbi:MAG: fasciclin domain-containing protein [Gammaproteobacteria bacterium]|nr:fasciclin domain-containing protein [Gammaproteobacteria bacterium]